MSSSLSGFLSYDALLHTTWFQSDVLQLDLFFSDLATYHAIEMSKENLPRCKHRDDHNIPEPEFGE